MKLEQLINDIYEDCMVRGVYRDEEGRTCAIGHMAIKAGCEDLLPDDDPSLPIWNERLDGLRNALITYYEIEATQLNTKDVILETIQRLNDLHLTPEGRREAITDFLRTIYTAY